MKQFIANEWQFSVTIETIENTQKIQMVSITSYLEGQLSDMEMWTYRSRDISILLIVPIQHSTGQ